MDLALSLCVSLCVSLRLSRLHPYSWDRYCSLYDKGYSSVGLMKNTERNQNLVRPDGTYRPAWELDRY